MAKLSAHGHEIGRVEYIGKVKAYMADGKVLVNYGQGWKVGGKLKEGLTPEGAFSNARDSLARLLAERPALAEYRKCILKMAGIGKRWKLVQCLQLLGDDIDGIWSECCDGYGENIHADIDEIAELCRLYALATAEGKRLKESAIA